MTVLPGPCPLCDRVIDRTLDVDGRGIDQIECRTCGTFRFSPVAEHLLQDDSWKSRRWMLSGVTRRASDNGSPVELRTDNLEEIAAFAHVPSTPFEALDAVMRLIGSRVTDLEGFSRISLERDYPLVFARNRAQLSSLVSVLHRQKLITFPKKSPSNIQLSLTGWERVESLRKTSPNSDQAFVAMAFAEELKSIFTDAIAPALRAVGYEPFRVDERLHNEKIDDRIVAGIRQSGLLVADFTTQRAGVYWEAGFAQGLGIHVIRTCRKDDLKHLHFDTRQYLHVEWTTETELRERLEVHIRATIPGRANIKMRTT